MWHFSSAKSLHNVERIQERALRFLSNENTFPLEKLRKKSGKTYFSLKSSLYWNLQNYEAAKPHFYSRSFFCKSTANTSRSQRNPHNLLRHRPNQMNFGTNSLRALGPQIWNWLPNRMKSAQKTCKKLNTQFFVCPNR